MQVKKLEWQESTLFSAPTAVAKTEVANYHVYCVRGEWLAEIRKATLETLARSENFETAKSFCQEDFERRVLSCTVTPLKQQESQPAVTVGCGWDA